MENYNSSGSENTTNNMDLLDNTYGVNDILNFDLNSLTANRAPGIEVNSDRDLALLYSLSGNGLVNLPQTSPAIGEGAYVPGITTLHQPIYPSHSYNIGQGRLPRAPNTTFASAANIPFYDLCNDFAYLMDSTPRRQATSFSNTNCVVPENLQRHFYAQAGNVPFYDLCNDFAHLLDSTPPRQATTFAVEQSNTDRVVPENLQRHFYAQDAARGYQNLVNAEIPLPPFPPERSDRFLVQQGTTNLHAIDNILPNMYSGEVPNQEYTALYNKSTTLSDSSSHDVFVPSMANVTSACHIPPRIEADTTPSSFYSFCNLASNTTSSSDKNTFEKMLHESVTRESIPVSSRMLQSDSINEIVPDTSAPSFQALGRYLNLDDSTPILTKMYKDALKHLHSITNDQQEVVTPQTQAVVGDAHMTEEFQYPAPRPILSPGSNPLNESTSVLHMHENISDVCEQIPPIYVNAINAAANQTQQPSTSKGIFGEPNPMNYVACLENNNVSSNTRRRKGSICKFCRKNNQTPEVYRSHRLRNQYGIIACPSLRSHICEICGATGDNAHTRKYCPNNTHKDFIQTLEKQ